LKNPFAADLTISASVPVPRAGGFGGRSDDANLKPICSRELHSMATFSVRTAIGGGSGSVTSEKGIGEKFGEIGFSERKLIGRGDFKALRQTISGR
jgi:hypothetical protein